GLIGSKTVCLRTLLFGGFRTARRRRLCLGTRFLGRLGLRRLVAVAGRGLRAALSVIGDVPAASLELQRRRGEQPLDRSAAFLMCHDGGIAELLHQFEDFTAGITLIFVKWHENRGPWHARPSITSIAEGSSPSFWRRPSWRGLSSPEPLGWANLRSCPCRHRGAA